MDKMIYDIFISYRREGGGATAGRINDMLTADGYSVSYDVDTLREGRFDKQLLERIEQCQDSILVVDKNCFARTIDPSTDPQDDWLWQELSYALQLKKNIIPILLGGASFPKRLPEDINDVRFCNGPKCVHEYFDSFYIKLKDYLRAYPRMEKSQQMGLTTPTNKLPCLKLKADVDCMFYLDGEERSHLKAGIIQKFPLVKGEYELMFVSEENSNDCLELEFVMPDVDKLQKVNLCDIRDARLQKEAEAKRSAEEKRQAEEKKRKEEAEARRIAEERRLAEERRNAEEKRLAEERKCEAERKAEEERKRREEEEWAKEKTFSVGDVQFKMIRVERNEGIFYIGETPVTTHLWDAVMGNAHELLSHQKRPPKYKSKAISSLFKLFNDVESEHVDVESELVNLQSKLKANHPMNYISWYDCKIFIQKLNAIMKQDFRLPNVDEWEYAAGGGYLSKGFKYSGSDNIEDVAWYDMNAFKCWSPKENPESPDYGTHPVKTKKPNELGIYDMTGNVSEWCDITQDSKRFKTQMEFDFNENLELPSQEQEYPYALCGGSWRDSAFDCQLQVMQNYKMCPPEMKGDYSGLRLAL